jgi:16S rRNA (guanine966-N2)-methyltransferase
MRTRLRGPMSDAGRVIAGRAAGRRLAAPPGEGTRPLADRVKQTLFAILEPDLDGAQVLDLFAGSGAAGIEALSRGAAGVVFVERDGRAAKTIAENLRATALAGPDAEIVGAEALAWLRRDATAGHRFDVVIVDPPYAETNLLAAVLARLGEADAPLAPGARVVAKHFWRDHPPGRIGLLASERERRFGETALTFYRRVAEEVG